MGTTGIRAREAARRRDRWGERLRLAEMLRRPFFPDQTGLQRVHWVEDIQNERMLDRSKGLICAHLCHDIVPFVPSSDDALPPEAQHASRRSEHRLR